MLSVVASPTLPSPLLADAAGLGAYISLAKILPVLVVFVLWSLANQWIDRDAQRIQSNREMWNMLTAAGGYGGLAVLILFPWSGAMFFVGLGFWVLMAGGTMLAYVVHRNGRLPENQRILTPAHVKRLMAQASGDSKSKVDKGLRVRLVDNEGEPIQRPSEPEELQKFDATQEFLFDALWKRASDVDVLVSQDQAQVVYKIDGVASKQSNGLSTGDSEKVIAFLKQHAGLKLEERRRPQRGKIKAGLIGSESKPGEVEVHTSGSTAGERLRLRMMGGAELKRLPDLGFMGDRLAKFEKFVNQETGLVIFAGPKESGITTTQYATLRAHDAFLQNIYALETEPLMELDNITQKVHRGAEEEVPYARMLQTVLRREPDVVMVSQCEDHTTAQVATTAATEKKIYIAMRASNCVDAIVRYMALLNNNELLSKTLVGVVAQRLIRALCPACREAYKPDEQLLRKANLPIDKIEYFYRPPSNPIVDKKGREVICQTCQSSRYLGRTGVFEVLVISDTMRKLIVKGAQAAQIKAQARSDKMRYLQEEGLLKVMEGTTSMAEVMRGLRDSSK